MRRLFLFAVLFSWAVTVQARGWPEGLSFIGLTSEGWRLYAVGPGESEPRVIATSSEPHDAAYHLSGGRIAFIAADGALRELDLHTGEEHTLRPRSDRLAWTQPAYDSAGRLFAVALKEGSSADTDIVQLTGTTVKQVVQQRSAQFEPNVQGRVLHYSNVLCTVGCGRIIQEIWRMDLLTGQARQVTLMNAISREPTASPDGGWLYFVSDRNGHYHIWRLAIPDGEPEPVTRGNYTDLSPALDGAGRLWFIRRTPQGVRLMVREAEGTMLTKPLPAGISDVRALEIAR